MSDDLTEAIIGAAVEVHKLHGPGLLESIYQEALCHEMSLRGIPFQKQVAVEIKYKGCAIQGQRLDLLVSNQVVDEIKTLRTIPEFATAQVLSYLKATGLRRPLIINFGSEKLVHGIKRVSL